MAMTATSCFRWMCIFISTMLRCNMLQRIGPRIVSAFSVSPFQRGARPPEASSVHPHSFLMLVTTKQLPAACHLFSTHTDNPEEEDTIFALSSGSLAAGGGATGVAVIRISGSQAHTILSNMTCNKPLPKPRMASVRNLIDSYTNTPLDQALVLLFEKPHSFTGEDVVELHCHGSRAVVEDMLDYLSTKARMAERGEFTQRAFLHGKLELLQVEALADLLTADTRSQRLQALSQLQGNLQHLYTDWRQRLTKGLAHAEAVIDFGDDEQLDENEEDEHVAQANVWGNVGEQIASLTRDMQRHLSDNRRGELVREGVKIAIVGPPNAGKSSLFNLLAQRDAAIVSPIAGTTRDVLELSLNLGGIKCTLSDTAGVRQESSDVIEQEGMKRARNVAKNADIVVAMVDVLEPEKGTSVLQDVLDMIHNENDEQAPEVNNVLLALNKLDLQDETGEEKFRSILPNELTRDLGGVFQMSCETNDGIDSFLDALTLTVQARISSNHNSSKDENEGALITRARHRQHVEAAVEALLRFQALSQQGTMAVDMAAEELRLATSELGRITGAIDVEDVLDVLDRKSVV